MLEGRWIIQPLRMGVSFGPIRSLFLFIAQFGHVVAEIAGCFILRIRLFQDEAPEGM